MSSPERTANIISGGGHVVLLVWVLFGGMFSSRPEPVEIQEVGIVTGAEYQALVDAARQPVVEAPEAVPAAPEVTPEAPEVDVAEPEPVAPPPPSVEVAEPTPEPAEEVVPDVSEAAPESTDVPAEVTVQDAPVSSRPVERPAEVIAPTPAPAPEPEAVQEPEPQEAVIPEATGETVEPPREAAQAPEATNRTVTEAAEPPAASPTQSSRPPARRPSAPRPVETAQTAPTPPAAAQEETNAVDDAAVQAALEAAMSSATNTVPTGPPMSSAEKDGLRLAVQACWNVDPGARWAQTTVTVAMDMTQDGKVVANSLRMIASEGGDSSTADAAFGAARRAILLCQKDGFPLPPEKYGQWQEIEMTFNPERMRIR
jgi:hypothetical protein